MKTSPIRIIVAALLGFAAVHLVYAEKVVGGPKGGRLLEAVPAKAEFFVDAERRAEVLFYDEAMRPILPGTQVVNLIAEAPGGRVALEMERSASGFVSQQPLPDGAPYRVVVQIRPAAGEKPQNFRIDLNLANCGECSRVEYACTCEGH